MPLPFRRFPALLCALSLLACPVFVRAQPDAGRSTPAAGGTVTSTQAPPLLPADSSAAPDGSAGGGADSSAAADQGTQGNVAEFAQLQHNGQLTPMRNTQEGSYGARLAFLPSQMVYYVALVQNDQVWRVVKTDDRTRADGIYVLFARQCASLSRAEFDRTQLTAQNALYQRAIEVSRERARRLAVDLAVEKRQQQEVNQRQAQVRADAISLQGERIAAEQQLQALQRQVRELQQRSEDGLP